MDQLIDKEMPELLIGSPPCTVFSLARNRSNFKRDEVPTDQPVHGEGDLIEPIGIIRVFGLKDSK